MAVIDDGGAHDGKCAAPTGADLIRRNGLRRVMLEDFRAHGGAFFSPGLHTVWVYRIGVWASTLPRGVRMPFSALYMLGHWFCKVFYSIELERSAKIGRRFRIGHQGAIVIHRFATFGDDCLVRQGVTLGSGSGWTKGRGPVIGDNVHFGPGAVVVGNIRIGDNVRIGPNCVVTTDVPSDRVLFAPPPRVFPRNADNEDMSEDMD